MRFRIPLCLLMAALLFPGIAATGNDIVKGKPALIVMDTQNAFMPMMDSAEIDPAKGMINATIALFREQGLPVIRVYHSTAEHGPPKGTDAFEFPSDIAISDSDPMVVKSFPSAFKDTELKSVLDKLGCDTVFLSGLSATGCVSATFWEANSLGLDVFMVRGGLISHKHSLTEAVEEMTGAVGYQAIRYMVAHAPR